MRDLTVKNVDVGCDACIAMRTAKTSLRKRQHAENEPHRVEHDGCDQHEHEKRNESRKHRGSYAASGGSSSGGSSPGCGTKSNR